MNIPLDPIDFDIFCPLISHQPEFKEMRESIIDQNQLAIRYFIDPSDDLKIRALKQCGKMLKYIKNPTLEMQLIAVRQSGEAIASLENPSVEIQLEAVRAFPFALKYIKNPPEIVQVAACKRSRKALKYIENPSRAVKAAARNKAGKVLLFECCVNWVEDQSIGVTMHDLTFYEPESYAELKAEAFNEDERKQMLPGTVFYWRVTDKNEFIFYVDYITKEEIAEANRKTEEMMAFFKSHICTDNN